MRSLATGLYLSGGSPSGQTFNHFMLSVILFADPDQGPQIVQHCNESSCQAQHQAEDFQ